MLVCRFLFGVFLPLSAFLARSALKNCLCVWEMGSAPLWHNDVTHGDTICHGGFEPGAHSVSQVRQITLLLFCCCCYLKSLLLLFKKSLFSKTFPEISWLDPVILPLINGVYCDNLHCMKYGGQWAQEKV